MKGITMKQTYSVNTASTSAILFLLILSSLSGCQSAYYGTMEAFGIHKRDILVDRVEEARDEQAQAKDEFQSALVAFTTATDFQGSELADLYDDLNDHYEDCEDRAEAVRSRIEGISAVSVALFDEWDSELEQYHNNDLRAQSEQTLQTTRQQCDNLIRIMQEAAIKMDPVLAAFHDQVLFLKHNLNAQAIASLEGNAAQLQSTIADLVAEMERAIDEANSFIAAMNRG